MTLSEKEAKLQEDIWRFAMDKKLDTPKELYFCNSCWLLFISRNYSVHFIANLEDCSKRTCGFCKEENKDTNLITEIFDNLFPNLFIYNSTICQDQRSIE